MPWPLLRRCLLFGLLGLVTAVAVAWGCSARWQLQPQAPRPLARGLAVADDAIRRVLVYRGPGIDRQDWELVDVKPGGALQEYRLLEAERIQAMGAARYDAMMQPTGRPIAQLADGLAARGPPVRVDDIARGKTFMQWTCAGWPLRGLRFSSRIDLQSPGADEYVVGSIPMFGHGHTACLEIPWSRAPAGSSVAFTGAIVLPLEPRPGLLLNTIFYGLLWALILLAPGAIRRRIRRARGRCPKCGYSLTGQAAPGCPECGHGRNAAPLLAVD